MTKDEQIKLTGELLFNKFNSISLTTKQVSTIIPRSIISLRRDRGKKQGLPYSQLGDGKGRDIAMYGIYDIAEFMLDNQVKVA